MPLAKNSGALHWCWITAHLYEEQISIGVIALTQACCESVLQSSTEEWVMHFALNRAAVHWCWLTVNLYEEQISIGVTSMTHCLPAYFYLWQAAYCAGCAS